MAGRLGIEVRDIDPGSTEQIEWVARGMRATLVEVEGEEVGAALYTMDWLRDRVLWHLGAAGVVAKVALAWTPDDRIVGHTIVRIEREPESSPFGLVSTTYVLPGHRRTGIAEMLLRAGELWFAEQGLARACTWTSNSNDRLIGLYRKHGYAVSATHIHEVTGTTMVCLSKALAP